MERGVIEFLQTQPNIKHLSSSPSLRSWIQRFQTQESIPEHILPSLSTVDAPVDIIDSMGLHRPFTHLRTEVENFHRFPDLLFPFGSTLVSLDISFKAPHRLLTHLKDNSFIPSFILELEGKLPKIKFLRVSQPEQMVRLTSGVSLIWYHADRVAFIDSGGTYKIHE